MDILKMDDSVVTMKNNTKENNIEIMKSIDSLPVVATMNDLIRELHKVFESDSVNVDYVRYLMKSYKSNPAEWKKYAKFDRFRYTRNLVDEGNGKFNLMILCWGEGHGSAIHDHANAHCFMKMLHGDLEEIRFAWPTKIKYQKTEMVHIGDDISAIEEEGEELNEISRSRLETNEVCYINDSLGLHRVENPSHTETAVSLHLYCPPFNSCQVFNQRTGQCSRCPVTFWSKFGQKRQREIQDARAPEDN